MLPGSSGGGRCSFLPSQSLAFSLAALSKKLISDVLHEGDTASRWTFNVTANVFAMMLLALASIADHPHTIDRWDDATGENLIEQIAVSDYLVALETYRAAVKPWPKDKITLRNRARVLERNWAD
jgi:hypothetical protein